ncbi:MAG: extradiol dioxygenase [Pirellulaceae bacterium]|nr:extradiol dioxygenase [Pirellulaceae bacterium]
MITGAHTVIYTADPDADRAFFRDVLKFPNVDVGGGWLIFGLPPAELAFHPADASGATEFYLMCDDVAAVKATLQSHAVETTDINDEGWGLLMHFTLPGGGKVGIYQPRHQRPDSVPAK